MSKIKYENEITVELEGDYDKIKFLLLNQNFQLTEEYDIIDIYMIKNDCKSNKPLEMLKDCVLIRNIITDENNIKKLVYKYKEYNDKEEIIKQGKVSCSVDSLECAQDFLGAIGYRFLIKIIDHIKVFNNGEVEFAVQLVNDKHIYLELEENGLYNCIDKMKEKLNSFNLPIKGNNYFVKKAEVEITENSQ